MWSLGAFEELRKSSRSELEPKSDTWTLFKSSIPGFSFLSFGFSIEKHSNTACSEIEVESGFFFFFLIHTWKIPRSCG